MNPDRRAIVIVILAMAFGALVYVFIASHMAGLPHNRQFLSYTAMMPVLILLGVAVGYGRRWSWIILVPLLLILLSSAGLCFSSRFWRDLGAAPRSMIAAFIGVFAAGLAIGWFARFHEERRGRGQ